MSRILMMVVGMFFLSINFDTVNAQISNLPPEKEVLLLKAKKAWSAFECSALASKMENSGEQGRLFNYGLQEGRAFLKAAQENKFSREDATKIVPIGFLMIMEGPSHDFILGRLWESTVENSLKNITRDKDGQIYPKEIIKIRAHGKFNSENCTLLGR